MKNSRERTILIAVLGVAGLGLFADRFFLGGGVTGPSESSAGVINAIEPAPVAPQDVSTQPAATPSGVAAATPSDKPSIASRIEQLTLDTGSGTSGEQRDAFAPLPGWNTGTVTDTAQPIQPQSAQAFLNSYKLDAVLVTGERQCAVVNGRTVYVGGSIDGYNLLSVLQRSAIFEKNGSRFEIKLAGRAPSS